MAQSKDSYVKHSISQIDRVLSNMDRNKESPTYGCLCRPYWHDKAMDFPSTHQQIGVLPLAVVYGNKLPNNPYEEDERIQKWCYAGIEFWKKAQKKNGSFDEHYPREHSLGATAWTLWAMTETVKHLDNPPEIGDAVQKAVGFIASYDEPGKITNHQAVTASALFNSRKHAKVSKELVKDRLSIIQERQSPEGWFLEYRGGDPGYQSTTIAHLARIWKEEPELIDERMLEDAVKFFSNFIDDENYYGSRIGSRKTQHVHPTGFEILSEEFNEASKIAYCIREHLNNSKILLPTSVDDKHFSWHQAEFLQSYLHAKTLDSEDKNIENKTLQDFIIRSKEEKKILINLSRGGYMKYYRNGKLHKEVSGATTKIRGKAYTANWIGSTENSSIENNKVKVRGYLRKNPRNNLDSTRYLLLRLFQHTLGRLPNLSLKMKNILIDWLITGGGSKYEFERVIDLENGEVVDNCEGEIIEGKTSSMFIPNSEYFQYKES